MTDSMRLRLMPLFLQIIQGATPNPESILDVGCGGLRNAFKKEFGDQYIGIDIDRGRIIDRPADAHKLPFIDASFDVVTAWSVLEHLENPFVAVGEMLRVARRFVLVSTDFAQNDKDGSPFHLYSWTPMTFQQFLEKQGYPVKVWVESKILFGIIKKTI